VSIFDSIKAQSNVQDKIDKTRQFLSKNANKPLPAEFYDFLEEEISRAENPTWYKFCVEQKNQYQTPDAPFPGGEDDDDYDEFIEEEPSEEAGSQDESSDESAPPEESAVIDPRVTALEPGSEQDRAEFAHDLLKIRSQSQLEEAIQKIPGYFPDSRWNLAHLFRIVAPYSFSNERLARLILWLVKQYPLAGNEKELEEVFNSLLKLEHSCRGELAREYHSIMPKVYFDSVSVIIHNAGTVEDLGKIEWATEYDSRLDDVYKHRLSQLSKEDSRNLQEAITRAQETTREEERESAKEQIQDVQNLYQEKINQLEEELSKERVALDEEVEGKYLKFSIVGNAFLFSLVMLLLFAAPTRRGGKEGKEPLSEVVELEKKLEESQSLVVSLDSDLSKYKEAVERLEKSDKHLFSNVVEKFTRAQESRRLDHWKMAVILCRDFLLKHPQSEYKGRATGMMQSSLEEYLQKLLSYLSDDAGALGSRDNLEGLRLVLRSIEQGIASMGEEFRNATISRCEMLAREWSEKLKTYQNSLSLFYASMDSGDFEKAGSLLDEIQDDFSGYSFDDLQQDYVKLRFSTKIKWIERFIARGKQLRTDDGDDGNPYHIFSLYSIHNKVGLKSRAALYLQQFVGFQPVKALFDQPEYFLDSVLRLQKDHPQKPEIPEDFLGRCLEYARTMDVDALGTRARGMSVVARAFAATGQAQIAYGILNEIVLKTEFYDTSASEIKARALLALLPKYPPAKKSAHLIQLQKMDVTKFQESLLEAYVALGEYRKPLELAKQLESFRVSRLASAYAHAGQYERIEELLQFCSRSPEGTEYERKLLWFEVAKAYVKDQRFSEARLLLPKLVTTRPTEDLRYLTLEPRMRAILAEEMGKLGKKREALGVIKTGVDNLKKLSAEVDWLIVKIHTMRVLAQAYKDIGMSFEASRLAMAAFYLVEKIPNTEPNLYLVKHPFFTRLIESGKDFLSREDLSKVGLKMREYMQAYEGFFIKEPKEYPSFSLALARAGLIQESQDLLEVMAEKELRSDLSKVSEAYLEAALAYSRF